MPRLAPRPVMAPLTLQGRRRAVVVSCGADSDARGQLGHVAFDFLDDASEELLRHLPAELAALEELRFVGGAAVASFLALQTPAAPPPAFRYRFEADGSALSLSRAAGQSAVQVELLLRQSGGPFRLGEEIAVEDFALLRQYLRFYLPYVHGWWGGEEAADARA